MTPTQIQIEIQHIIDGLAQIQVMATWTLSPENLPDYLDEIADEVNALSKELRLAEHTKTN